MKLIRFIISVIEGSSEFVKQNGQLPDVEEYIMLTLVGYIARKVFSDAAMPVGTVGLIKELLDELTDLPLGFFLIDGFIDLLLDLVFHVLVHFADNPVNVSLCHFKFKFLFI